MRTEGRRRSANVDDRRGRGPGGGGIKLGGGGIILLLVLAVVFKVNPLSLLDQAGGLAEGGTAGSQPLSEEQQRLAEFSSVILASTEEVWTEEFRKMGLEYEKPTMVLFTGATRSGCGHATSQVGPFYCPADSQVYLDLSFFDEMSRRFRAPGDFA